jgi:hypothetical protein
MASKRAKMIREDILVNRKNSVEVRFVTVKEHLFLRRDLPREAEKTVS